MTRFRAHWFVCRALSLTSGPRVSARLREDIRSGTVDWAQIVELASQHLVCPALYRGLSGKRILADAPRDARDYFAAAYSLNDERNQRLQHSAMGVVRSLNGVGVEPVLLKGLAGMFLGTYPDPAARVLRDLDLLVPEKSLRASVAALRGHGFELLAPDHEFPADHHHHPWLFRPDVPAVVELHHEAVSGRWQRLLPTQAVWRASAPLSVGRARMRVPSAEDRLTHALIHAIDHAVAHHGNDWYTRVPIREMLEVVWLRAAVDPLVEWARLADRFDRHDAGLELRTLLHLTRRTLNAAVPTGVPITLRARAAYWWHFAQMLCPLLTMPATVSRDLAGQARDATHDPLLSRRFASKLLSPLAYANVALRLHGAWGEGQREEP